MTLRRTLAILLLLFGATDVCIGLAHIALGPAAIPHSIPVNATMDSEDRFYATLFIAYGISIIWCAREVEHRSRVLYFLLATFFAGGIARLISAAIVGPPATLFVALTVVELALPILLAWLCQRVVRSANMAE